MRTGADGNRDEGLAFQPEELEAVERDLEALIDHARHLTPVQLNDLIRVIRQAVSDQAAEP